MLKTHLLGSVLIFLSVVQIGSGLYVLFLKGVRLVFVDQGVGSWVFLYSHKIVPSFFIFCVYLHVLRGILLYKSTFVAWTSGSLLFLYFFVSAASGYVLTSGEAGFWGGNWLVGGWLNSALDGAWSVLERVSSYFPTALCAVQKSTLVTSIIGSTVLDKTAGAFLLFLHVLVVYGFVSQGFTHIQSGHLAASDAFSVPRIFTAKTPLVGFVETRDFFLSFTVLFIVQVYGCFVYIFARVGNHSETTLQTLTPPVVFTEWYLTVFYQLLKVAAIQQFVAFFLIVVWFYFVASRVSCVDDSEFVFFDTGRCFFWLNLWIFIAGLTVFTFCGFTGSRSASIGFYFKTGVTVTDITSLTADKNLILDNKVSPLGWIIYACNRSDRICINYSYSPFCCF